MAARPKLRFPWLLGLALIPACAGGDGCTSGCGGITPLPGGFVAEERIENAAAVRITPSGLEFIEQNIGDIAPSILGQDTGIVTFDIPQTSGSVNIVFNINYTICAGGQPCTVEVDLSNADLQVTTQAPTILQIEGTIPVRLASLPIDTSVGDATATMTGNQACPDENQTFAPVDARIRISVETDNDVSHARYGYSRIRIDEIYLDQADIEDALKLDCGGFLGTILNFAKGLVVDQLFGGLTDTLASTVEEQLCQASNPAVSPSCPTGTNDVDGICRYGTTADDPCVSMVLGLDGHANLSSLLAGISPGTQGGMDFLLAGGGQSLRPDASGRTFGDLNPIGGGATVGFYGGVEPTPVSGCVPISNLPRPTGLAIPTELLDDTLVAGDWPADVAGPHLGLGISESFFNYALAGMYNSGLLCIGFSTETVDLLNSTTLGLLASSLRDLSLQREEAPIAIVLKPQNPPHVEFGGGTNLTDDPLIDLTLEQASFDFYILSHDRYIRFMTATFDVRAPVNLSVTPEGLVPVLDTLDITNGVITNADLLREDPAVLAASLQSLLSSQIGNLIGSGLPAVDLNDSLASLGLRLVIPESTEGGGSAGLRKLTVGDEDYLGIFAAFEVAGAQTAALTRDETVSTEASVSKLLIDQEGLRGATLRPDNVPEIVIAVDSDSNLPTESQARVDGGIWKPWARTRSLSVTDEALRLEGRHVVEVRSRIIGRPYTLDPTPTELEVLVDTVPPTVAASMMNEAGEVTIDAYDQVSKGATAVRYRFDDGEFSAWLPAGDVSRLRVPAGAEEIELEARDESGQVGTARQAVIRGLPKAAGDSACGCSVPGAGSTPPWTVGLGVLGVFAALARVLRRRSRPAASAAPAKSVGRRVGREAAAAAAVLSIAGVQQGCSCDDDTVRRPSYSCEDPCLTLDPGLIGSYTSSAVDADGQLWVAGYLEADYNLSFQYGDLVVGRLEGEAVTWEIVDGVPEEPEVDGEAFNLEGFRGGQTAPGDDVGLWTSIAVDPAGRPAVAYYDRTNRALKYAQYSGTTWEVQTVDGDPGADGSDVGRYAKLVFDGDVATIAYLSIEPAATGPITSKVRIARAASGGGFVLDDVVSNDATPCRARFCSGGAVCVEASGECAAASTSCSNCADGEVCATVGAAATCVVPVPDAKLDAYPLATGLYVSLQKSGSGLVIGYYDRVAGTLNVAREAGDGWDQTVVDGLPGADGSPADVGVGASLFVDGAGDLHLTYVDGYAEALRYARVVGDDVETEIVDDGLSLNGVAFPDGQHIVGDDSFVRVTPSGDVHVSYQDATSGKLRYAVGTPITGGHDWSQREIAQDGFAGFFSSQVELDGGIRLVHFWRRAKDRIEGNVAVSTP